LFTIAAVVLGYVSTWISIACFLVTIVLYVMPKPIEVVRDEEQLASKA
jgi:cytochrome oxidase assembly protein ShyY1